mmetsp:Transcript_26387/g.47380  ORF Transcript_26387/g.47380 Transcript_26387/m.47380 type:complete len:212 (-) Transcript_26387:1094-1729(-)
MWESGNTFEEFCIWSTKRAILVAFEFAKAILISPKLFPDLSWKLLGKVSILGSLLDSSHILIVDSLARTRLLPKMSRLTISESTSLLMVCLTTPCKLQTSKTCSWKMKIDSFWMPASTAFLLNTQSLSALNSFNRNTSKLFPLHATRYFSVTSRPLTRNWVFTVIGWSRRIMRLISMTLFETCKATTASLTFFFSRVSARIETWLVERADR